MKLRTFALAVLLALSILSAVPAAANTAPPSPPHYFYGTLKIDNVDAPIGTTVEARVAGVLNGDFNPIVTTEVGKYSDPEPPFTFGLLVQGEIAEGATIEFWVNGTKANETAAWHSGQLTNLNLTAGSASTPLTVPPAVLTSGATGVTLNSATLFGTLTSLGTASSVMVYFEYGVTTGYGSVTPVQIMAEAISFNASLSGLLPNTTYHYRTIAVAGSTIVYGVDRTFRTTAIPVNLTVSTGAATNIAAATAILNGNLVELTGATTGIVSFQWGTTQAYGNETMGQILGAPGPFIAFLNGLLPNTLYHYRAKAMAGTTIVFGSDQTFRTGTTILSSSGGATSFTSTSGGNVSTFGVTADKELKLDASGKSQNESKLTDSEKKLTVSISSGTSLKMTTGEALQFIYVTTPASIPPVPAQSIAISSKDMGPDGATFSPPISLAFSYDVSTLPPGVSEDGLYLAFWDGSQWVKLASTVDKEAKTVTANVSHFTLFALMATVIAPPSVTIISPAGGANLPAGDIQVAVQVSSFVLVPPGGLNAAGQGHIHYYLDVAIPTTPGQPAVTALGTYQATVQPVATWANVPAGAHTLGVQLVNNDHTPLTPPVTDQITVNVTGTALITILPPPPSSVTSPPDSTAPESTVSPPSSETTTEPVPTPTSIPEATNWALILIIIVVAGILLLAILVFVP
ncbi:MAG: hypothetical protein HY662_01720 [Chloroflexi bacterium]|nr:hypothetical protein [Chloroflexota bacterium]